MKKIMIIVALVLTTMFFLKSYFRETPDECNAYFETRKEFLAEITSSRYVSESFINQYKKDNDEYNSLFKKGIRRETDTNKIRTTCLGLNSLLSSRLKKLKQAKTGKEFRALL